MKKTSEEIGQGCRKLGCSLSGCGCFLVVIAGGVLALLILAGA